MLATISQRSTQQFPLRKKSLLPAAGCYAYYSGKDTVFLQVRITGNKVSGNLIYHYFEKDKMTEPYRAK